MRSISAHVKNGLIVPDEQIGLFEGEAVEVIVQDDIDDEMTAEERAELESRSMRARSSSSAASLWMLASLFSRSLHAREVVLTPRAVQSLLEIWDARRRGTPKL